MSLERWFNPWDSLVSDRNSFSFPRNNELSGWRPAINCKETDQHYQITAELPGVKPDDIKIELTNDNFLIVSGEKKYEYENEPDSNYHVEERSYGKFMRRMQLPKEVDESNIQAGLKDGVLNIIISKPEKKQQQPYRRSIPIGKLENYEQQPQMPQKAEKAGNYSSEQKDIKS